MAKIDKEALKKNQFWIGLGAFALIWLIGVIVVLVTGSEDAKKAWEGALGKVKSANPKTKKHEEPWEVHGKKFGAKKGDIHEKAWREQEVIYRWPEGMRVVPRYIIDEFGGDRVASANNRDMYRDRLYASQFEGLDAAVLPATFAGGFNAVFPKQVWDPTNPPTREEIWLAQENFWVRYEMLAIVRATMDAVSWFHEVDLKKERPEEAKQPLPKGILGRRVFRNANWELDLLFEENTKRGRGWQISEQSTIKNINATHRTLNLMNPRTKRGLPFRIYQQGGSAIYELRIGAEPLPYEGKAKLPKVYDVAPVDLRKPIRIEQLLEWEISPIRRVDALALGHHSHRTSTMALKVNEELKKLDPDPAAEGTEGTTSGDAGPGGTGAPGTPGAGMSPPSTGRGGRMPGAPGGEGGPGEGGPGDFGTTASRDFTRFNRIPRERYVQITPQCKHLPIAMRLIVDQAHISDVLAAVANSRLRIQVTQVTINHARDVQRPTQPGDGGEAGPGPGEPGGYYPGTRPPSNFDTGSPDGVAGSGAPSVPSLPPGGGMRGFGRGGPAGPGMPAYGRDDDFGFGAGTTAQAAAQFQDRTRLVELCIYGIAALYERYPPMKKPETTEPGTTTATPGTTTATPADKKP